jgi:ribosomal protein S27E
MHLVGYLYEEILLNSTAWVESRETRGYDREQTCTIGHAKNMSLYHRVTWFCFFTKQWSLFVRCFVCNNRTVSFMRSRTRIEQYRKKKLYYLTCTKHDCTSAQCIFKWNTSVTCHKKVGSASSVRHMSSLSANSSVTVISLLSQNVPAGTETKKSELLLEVREPIRRH